MEKPLDIFLHGEPEFMKQTPTTSRKCYYDDDEDVHGSKRRFMQPPKKDAAVVAPKPQKRGLSCGLIVKHAKSPKKIREKGRMGKITKQIKIS